MCEEINGRWENLENQPLQQDDGFTAVDLKHSEKFKMMAEIEIKQGTTVIIERDTAHPNAILVPMF